MKSIEHEIQKAYFKWASMQKVPGLDLLHANANGGHRHLLTAVKLKSEGVKAGVPDVYLPAPRGGFCGLAIEFKAPDGNPSKEQRERMNRMQQEGWCVTLCWDWSAAARMTLGYLGMAKLEFGGGE